MAKHLDETPGNKVPIYARNAYYQNNPYFDSSKYAKSDNKPKKQNNSYKPSKSTKRGDTVGAGEYAVSKGDSLWKIAQAYGTTVEALKKANSEIKGNMIYPGQIINIGSKQNNTTSTSNDNTTTTTTQSVADIIKANSQRFTNNTNNNNNQIERRQNDVIVDRDNKGRLVLTSPFTQPEQIDYSEPIRLRKSLKPAVIKGKRSIKTTKGNNNIQQELRKRNAFYKIVDNM